MKNFIQPGNSIDIQAPNDVSSGEGVVIGSLFGISSNTVLSGVDVSIGTEGVYDVAKLAANVMAVGDKVNFNNATKEVQLATSTLDGVGTVVEAAGAAVTSVKIKLTPV